MEISFRIKSIPSANIISIAGQEFCNNKCTIKINNTSTISVPLILAIANSPLFGAKYSSDITTAEFEVETNFYTPVTDSFIQKLQDALSLLEVKFDNDDEIMNFACFGKSIKNEEFKKPFMEYCEKMIDQNNDTSLELIKKKFHLQFSDQEFGKEISIIATNFDKNKDVIFDLGKDPKYYNAISLILQSSDLRVCNEDSLLEYIIKFCEIDQKYECLFQYVWLDYCSVKSIQTFLDYINNNMVHDENLKSVFTCLQKRLLRANIPVLPMNIRYNYQLVENNSDSLDGIFRKEGDVIAYDEKKSFNIFECSKIPLNTWTIYLKNRTAFVITKYKIKGALSNNRLENWEVQGLSAVSNKWFILDSQQKQNFGPSQCREFIIQSRKPITMVALKTTTSSSFAVTYISGFEVYGWIHPK